MSLMFQRWLGLSLFLVGLCGCSDEVVDQAGITPSGGYSGNDSIKTDDGVPLPPVPTLDAAYAWSINSALIVETLASGETKTVHASMSGFVTVEQAEEEVALVFNPCMAELPANDSCKLVISRETIESTPPLTTTARFSYQADNEDYVMALEPDAFLAGVELEAPLTDSLPTDKNDERLTDTDGDNKVGITMTCSGLAIYAALRLIISPDVLSQTQDSEWLGSTELNLEVSVVADTIPFVNVQKKLDEALEKIRIAEQDNHFALTPLAERELDDAITCDDLYPEQSAAD